MPSFPFSLKIIYLLVSDNVGVGDGALCPIPILLAADFYGIPKEQIRNSPISGFLGRLYSPTRF
jgi:hypothetical protein